MKPIIGIHVGQAGIQIGAAMWELLCLEHEFTDNGFKCANACASSNASVMFMPVGGKKYMANAIFIDSDKNTLNRLSSGPNRHLYHSDFFILSKFETGGIYPRGYDLVGYDVANKVLKCVRRIVEFSGYPSGFLFTHSYGGGTGTGVTAHLQKYFKEIYPKAAQLQLAIFPTQRFRSSNSLTIEPYNIGLHYKETMDCVVPVIVADNEALMKSLHNRCHVSETDYQSVNRLLAHILSLLTVGSRFPINEALMFKDIQTNLVLNKYLRFVIPSFAPLTNESSFLHESFSSSGITSDLFEPRAQLFTADTRHYPVMAGTVIYRGGDGAHINSTLAGLIKRNAVRFTKWIPAGFKIGRVREPPSFVEYGGITTTSQYATLLTNTTAMIHPWNKIRKDFLTMFQKKAFLHWYTEAGLFYDDLLEASEYMAELVKQYGEAIGIYPDKENSTEEI